MNWSKFFITFVVLYVVGGILNFLIHGVILADTYAAIDGVWRMDMDRLMWLQWVLPVFSIFFFIYIFARGYEGKGVMEGVRYGLIIWGFISIPMSFSQYMVYPIPYSLVWEWIISDLVVLVIMGILTAVIYKPAEAPKAA